MRALRTILVCAALLGATALPCRAQESGAPADAVAIGAEVDARFVDRRWQPRRLHELGADAATVLFFAGISSKFTSRRLQAAGIAAAVVIFVAAFAWMLTMPISFGV